MSSSHGHAPAHGLGELLRLAGPVILSRLGIMVMGLTDAIVVGRHSARELGYHALGWAPTMVVLTTAVGLLFGTQVLTARRVGEGRRDQAGAVLHRGLAYALLLGIGSGALLFLAGPSLLHSVRLEEDLADGASRALQVFALSLPTYLVAVACSLFLEALSKATPSMIFMWLANGVNLALNLLFVPGEFGVPGGAVGSAWATFGARTALMLMLLVYILTMPEARALGVFRRFPRDPAAAHEQRKIGFGAGASYFVEVAAFAGMSVVAGWLGGLAVAAWTVVLNVSAIVFMGPLGLGTATAVLVGRAYGARDGRGVVRAGFLGLAAAAVLTLVIALVVWPGAGFIAGLYATDPALVTLAASGLVLATLFFVADGLQVVAANALRARGDVWVPTAMHVTSYAVVMLPLGWALAHPVGLGLNGIVWSVIIASLVSAGFLCGRFAWLARRPLR
ncbi:MAG TPA: MATE family efflux transporter [Caulobacteraceae bacterium]|jgi:MATE family multidrug resistance protein